MVVTDQMDGKQDRIWNTYTSCLTDFLNPHATCSLEIRSLGKYCCWDHKSRAQLSLGPRSPHNSPGPILCCWSTRGKMPKFISICRPHIFQLLPALSPCELHNRVELSSFLFGFSPSMGYMMNNLIASSHTRPYFMPPLHDESDNLILDFKCQCTSKIRYAFS